MIKISDENYEGITKNTGNHAKTYFLNIGGIFRV